MKYYWCKQRVSKLTYKRRVARARREFRRCFHMDPEDLVGIQKMGTPTGRIYRLKMKEASKLIESDPMPDSADGQRLLELVSDIQAYEAKHFPI